MELSKIEKLLDAYFEGETNLEEEQVLMDFFCTQKVPVHLLQYKPIFIGLAAAREEKSSVSLDFLEEKPSKRNFSWKYAVAVVLILIGIGSVYISQPKLSAEEEEALAAFENSKEALRFLSENLNKGTKHLALVDEFEIAKNKVFETEK